VLCFTDIFLGGVVICGKFSEIPLYFIFFRVIVFNIRPTLLISLLIIFQFDLVVEMYEFPVMFWTFQAYGVIHKLCSHFWSEEL